MLGHSRYNRRLHRISNLFQTLFDSLAEVSKANNPNNIYAIDTYPVPVCDNIRISRCRIYQGEEWRGKIASKHRHFYGLKAHVMVTESGQIVEVFSPQDDGMMSWACDIICLIYLTGLLSMLTRHIVQLCR